MGGFIDRHPVVTTLVAVCIIGWIGAIIVAAIRGTEKDKV